MPRRRFPKRSAVSPRLGAGRAQGAVDLHRRVRRLLPLPGADSRRTGRACRSSASGSRSPTALPTTRPASRSCATSSPVTTCSPRIRPLLPEPPAAGQQPTDARPRRSGRSAEIRGHPEEPRGALCTGALKRAGRPRMRWAAAAAPASRAAGPRWSGRRTPRRRADAGASTVCGQAAGALAGGCLEAGRHYWAARCWTLLVWQPIYLQVLAVRLAGQAPCLTAWRRASNRASSPGSACSDHPATAGRAPAPAAPCRRPDPWLL